MSSRSQGCDSSEIRTFDSYVPERRIASLTGGLSSEGSPDPLESRHAPARTSPRPLSRRHAPDLGRATATLRRLRRQRRRLLSARRHLLSRLLLLEEQAPP